MNRLQSLFNTAANTMYGLFAKRPPENLLRNVKIVAHRGLHENSLAVENSRDAFRLAIENQIWGIEFDVRWTKDNVPVIHHDPDCQRIHNSSLVIAESTYAELKSVAPDLLLLEEVIQQFAQKIVFMIELKESLKAYPARAEKLEKLLARLIPRKHFYILALTPEILESVSFVSKKAMIDVALTNMTKTLNEALVFGHGGLSGSFVLLTEKHQKLCRENGLLTGTGFIESRGAFYREVGRGIDMIFTNTPLVLKSYL